MKGYRTLLNELDMMLIDLEHQKGVAEDAMATAGAKLDEVEELKDQLEDAKKQIELLEAGKENDDVEYEFHADAPVMSHGCGPSPDTEHGLILDVNYLKDDAAEAAERIEELERAFEEEKMIQASLANARRMGLTEPDADTLRSGRNEKKRPTPAAWPPPPPSTRPQDVSNLSAFLQDRDQRQAMARKLISVTQRLLSENTVGGGRDNRRIFGENVRGLIEMLKPLIDI